MINTQGLSLSLILIFGSLLASAESELSTERAQFPRVPFVSGNIVVRRVGVPVEAKDVNGNPIVKDTFCFKDLTGKKVTERELRRSFLGSQFYGAGGLWDEADLTSFTQGKNGTTYGHRDPHSPFGQHFATHGTYTDRSTNFRPPGSIVGVKVDVFRKVDWCQNPTPTSDSKSIVNAYLTPYSDTNALSFANLKRYLYAEGSTLFVLQGRNNEACITELINLDPSGQPLSPSDDRYLNVKSKVLKLAFAPKHVGLRNKAMTNLAQFIDDIHSGVSASSKRRGLYLDPSWNPGCSSEK